MPRELMIFLSLVGLGAVWVSLPLLPAILIYRLFPSTQVAVKGPLANFTVRAGGAFAGYLIIFATMIPLVQTTTQTMVGQEHHLWTVNGRVKLLAADGQEIRAARMLKKIEVHANPNPYIIESYMVRLTVIEDSEGELPLLHIDIPDFGTGSVDLRTLSKDIIVDQLHRTIKISDPIEIREDTRDVSPNLRAASDDASSRSDMPNRRPKPPTLR